MTGSFYSKDELPSGEQREKMWVEVRGAVVRKRPLVFIPDLRSFSYGIAASGLIYFSAVGLLSTVRNSITNAKPDAVKLDEAYQSAIAGFERVVPRMVASRDASASPSLTARQDELQSLNAAITELRSVAGEGDLSPLTQRRLRQLYSLKLQVLQQMIDNGEIEL